MTALLQFAREHVLLPLVRRPRLLQFAALCVRRRAGRNEVLLVTSRGTGRWVLPKGWPHKGTDGAGSALREAWEEAGVSRATALPEPVGRYAAVKRSASGLERSCEVLVYRADVREMAAAYPEEGQRKRVWVAPAEAATMVREPGLQALLRSLPDA